MVRRTFLAVAGASALSTIPAVLEAQRSSQGDNLNTASKSAYARIDGLQLYYEIHGSGKPLILLHGGISASETFGPNLTELAKTRQVIAAHMQGHGRTHDIDRPLRFESMADDVAALIAYLGFNKADVMGYSMGGGVALQTAIRHPAVIDRLVVVSATMKRSGSYPEILAAFDHMDAMAPQIAERVKHSPLAKLYPDVNWETLFRKVGEMESHDYDWSSGVAGIKAPTMLVFADADAVRYQHIVEFYQQLGGGQRDAGLDGSLRSTARLAIVPSATHYDIVSNALVASFVAPFLDAQLSTSGLSQPVR